MKRIIALATLCLCSAFAGVKNKPAQHIAGKIVEVKGALITPMRKGMLCVNYHYQGKKVSDCRAIIAGNTYQFVIPHKINRVNVTRSFDNQCAPNKVGKMHCKTLRNTFNVALNHNVLILDHEHNVVRRSSGKKIQHGYEPIGTFGDPTWSMTQPSVRFDRIYNGDPWSIY